MNGSVLLDTDTVVDLLRGDETVTEMLGNAGEAAISTVTLGELLYGAKHSTRPEEGVRRVEEFVGRVRVLPCDRVTAEVYSGIKNELRKNGRPIPENDIWIAASANQHGLTLIATDSHFQEVEDLALTSW